MGENRLWQVTILPSLMAKGTVVRRRDQRVMWFYRYEAIKISYHPVEFGGHRHSGNRDIMVLVCHVTLQDHVIKVLRNFKVTSPLG